MPPDLGAMVDALLAKQALGALGLARKAGAVALGAAKVEAAVRSGEALAVLHAARRRRTASARSPGARRATVHLGGPAISPPTNFFGGRIGFGIGRPQM